MAEAKDDSMVDSGEDSSFESADEEGELSKGDLIIIDINFTSKCFSFFTVFKITNKTLFCVFQFNSKD